MTTRTNCIFEGGIPDTYEKLCLAHFPRPLHDSVDYDNTVEIIDALAGLPLNKDQEDYLHILSVQVEEYENVNVPPPAKFSAVEMLHTVCDETGTNGVGLARVLGVSEGLVSLILKGRRPITIEHAKKLAAHFGVRPELFLDL
jgi:HTH-type transcriptional regulator / antitoxin HigA